MTTDEIRRIERETGLNLPSCYVEIVTNYPPDLAGSDAPDYGLLDDPDAIIEENSKVREEGYFGEKWPERYLIIGRNGCGDYYVTLLDADTFTVGFSDHEAMACNPYANNLSEFIEKYLREQGEI